jgi:hypothetical protein
MTLALTVAIPVTVAVVTTLALTVAIPVTVAVAIYANATWADRHVTLGQRNKLARDDGRAGESRSCCQAEAAKSAKAVVFIKLSKIERLSRKAPLGWRLRRLR